MGKTNFDIVEANGLTAKALAMTPDDSQSSVNMIPAGYNTVRLGANINDVNDFVVLPSLADVESGHTITIIAGSASSCVRTPSASNELINSVDCDGAQWYSIAATQIHRFTKIDDTIGWMAQGFTAIGAVASAVVPVSQSISPSLSKSLSPSISPSVSPT